MDEQVEQSAHGGDRQSEPAPTKVCSKCSVQSQTNGDFCPHCGKSYVRRRVNLRKVLPGLVASVLVVALAVGGVLWKNQRDEENERQAAAVAAAAEREEAQAEEEALADAARAERRQRQSLIKQLQRSVTKDAKERVADGSLDGPIFYTSCDPLGGGSVDDLTALTTTFECIAVNEKQAGGQVRGWVFSATMNWDDASWTWRLGR